MRFLCLLFYACWLEMVKGDKTALTVPLEINPMTPHGKEYFLYAVNTPICAMHQSWLTHVSHAFQKCTVFIDTSLLMKPSASLAEQAVFLLEPTSIENEVNVLFKKSDHSNLGLKVCLKNKQPNKRVILYTELKQAENCQPIVYNTKTQLFFIKGEDETRQPLAIVEDIDGTIMFRYEPLFPAELSIGLFDFRPIEETENREIESSVKFPTAFATSYLKEYLNQPTCMTLIKNIYYLTLCKYNTEPHAEFSVTQVVSNEGLLNLKFYYHPTEGSSKTKLVVKLCHENPKSKRVKKLKGKPLKKGSSGMYWVCAFEEKEYRNELADELRFDYGYYHYVRVGDGFTAYGELDDGKDKVILGSRNGMIITGHNIESEEEIEVMERERREGLERVRVNKVKKEKKDQKETNEEEKVVVNAKELITAIQNGEGNKQTMTKKRQNKFSEWIYHIFQCFLTFLGQIVKKIKLIK